MGNCKGACLLSGLYQNYAHTFAHHQHAGDRFGHAAASRQECQPHHRFRHCKCVPCTTTTPTTVSPTNDANTPITTLTHYRDHPHNQVRVQADEQHAHDKRDRIQAAPRLRIRYAHGQHALDRPRVRPPQRPQQAAVRHAPQTLALALQHRRRGGVRRRRRRRRHRSDQIAIRVGHARRERVLVQNSGRTVGGHRRHCVRRMAMLQFVERALADGVRA